MSLFYFLIPIIIIFGAQRLIGLGFTGWDTHDLSFDNFVYFRDCLANGMLPLWNPFIQSGTFFPSLFQIGHFALFQFPFAVLALLVPPMLAYEWMLQFVVLMGGVGAYVYFRAAESEQDIACLGAFIYTLTTMVVNIGQVWFIFSFAALPWLLAAAHAIVKGERKLSNWPLFGILLGFVYASGYQWMNLVNTGIFVAYVLFTYRYCAERARLEEVGLRLVLFLLPLLAVHLILIYPGLANLGFNYSGFSGDYANPEPRLRALGGGGWAYTYNDPFQAILGLINWASFRPGAGAGWTLGAGWATCLLLINAICRKPKLRPEYYFWGAIVAAGLIYSSATGHHLSALIRRVPLFSSNRWWVLGVDYSIIALVILTVTWLGDAVGNGVLNAVGRGKWCLRTFLAFLVLFLLYQHAPWYEFVVLSGLYFVLGVDGFISSRRHQLVAVAALAIFDWLLLVYCLPGGSICKPQHCEKTYRAALAGRIVSPVLMDLNERRLGISKDYDYTDTDWYVRKSPYSHGYDPLGNPIYWHLKDTQVVAHLFTVAQDIREEARILRAGYENDNRYVDAVVSDILARPDIPTINIPVSKAGPAVKISAKILHTELWPNKAVVRVQTNGPVLVSFNNNFVPGWEVFVDGKKAQLLSVNHIFMGTLLPAEGSYTVQFKFQPVSLILAIMAPYVALLAALLLFVL